MVVTETGAPLAGAPNLYTSANSFRKKNSSTLPTLVEATGIEPVSENPSSQLSTRVVYPFRFPHRIADKQAKRVGIPSYIPPSGERG